MIAVKQLSNLLDVSFNKATCACYFLSWKAIAMCSIVIELWLAGVLYNNNDDNNNIFSFNSPEVRAKRKNTMIIWCVWIT